MSNGNHQATGHTILLGGIGGDAHSVGLSILRQSLSAHGYRVRYLGTQNRLEDFFHLAPMVNAVMISCMDGHARYYLRAFPELMKQCGAGGTRWYLGGNLYVGNQLGVDRDFIEMGFHQAFAKFVDVKTVLSNLRRDLESVEPVADYPTLWELSTAPNGHLMCAAADDLLADELFTAQRREVLESWRTGPRAQDMRENAEFLSRQPRFPEMQAAVSAGRRPMLIQPRSGVPGLRQQIKLFKAFKSVGIRVLSYQVDSLTRNNNYAGAQEAIRESRLSGGASTLNGFPVVNHGVPGLRRIISEVKVALQTRHSTRDPRLLAEISYAGGVTSFEGGAVCYNIPYYKDYPLAESIRAWQYVDRLTGLYYERFGIKLDREFFGTLTATLIPPSLAIVVNIIEAVLAVRQGVKSVSLGYAEQGHRPQDMAAIRTLKRMATDVLRNLGYKDIQVSTVFHQYMAAFPEDARRAEELIYLSSVTATRSGATRIITKTPVEALRIPTLEDNLHGLSLTMRGVEDAALESIDENRVRQECDIIEREAQAILDSLIVCGRGSLTEGIVAGFDRGFIDIPFSPSIHNRGEVITARDVEGAVRFLSFGNLQFDRELREFHDSKMNDRRRAEGLLSPQENYLLVEQDVLQIARHRYQRWPLFK